MFPLPDSPAGHEPWRCHGWPIPCSKAPYGQVHGTHCIQHVAVDQCAADALEDGQCRGDSGDPADLCGYCSRHCRGRRPRRERDQHAAGQTEQPARGNAPRDCRQRAQEQRDSERSQPRMPRPQGNSIGPITMPGTVRDLAAAIKSPRHCTALGSVATMSYLDSWSTFGHPPPSTRSGRAEHIDYVVSAKIRESLMPRAARSIPSQFRGSPLSYKTCPQTYRQTTRLHPPKSS